MADPREYPFAPVRRERSLMELASERDELLAMLKRVVPALRDAEESLDEEIRSERGSMNDSPEPASRTVVEAEALIVRVEGGR